MAFIALFWFVLSVVMAGLEIEAEGKHGWAEKMPTWYRTTGPVARSYGRMMGGKPLTGYHSFMFFLPITFMHVPFVSGLPWSSADECKAMSLYFIVGVLWDFLWFVLNPHFGIRNFRRTKIWWHAKSKWVFGLFPADYLFGIAISTGLAVAGAYLSGDASRLGNHLALLGWLTIMTAICIAASPLYHKWRLTMNESDDRSKTDIFHT